MAIQLSLQQKNNITLKICILKSAKSATNHAKNEFFEGKIPVNLIITYLVLVESGFYAEICMIYLL